MKEYKKKIEPNLIVTPVVEEEEEKIDIHSMEVAVERVQAGLIGTLRIEDDCNRPLFKKGDLVHIRYPSKLQIKDIVLYQSHDAYFLRRIIKTREDDIFVAGDNEKEYHIIQKEDVVGKVILRQRKNKMLSFSLAPKKKIYTFKKVNLAFLRLGNRIIDHEQEVTNESLELAAQSAVENKTLFENRTEIKTNIDLDSDLASFLNPDTLVLELRGASQAKNDISQQQFSSTIEEIIEEVEYIDAEAEAEIEGEIQYVDEDGNVIENVEGVEYVEVEEEVDQEDEALEPEDEELE